uniref:Uncharacterized protein n=1 Tax=Nelumbo nucifera TaxID=4432 RepID=A0A822ZDN4_NELNU|nr:TPA_asm: hypothetical protein HUJ06_015868 [Nelumbo nucifera]
MKRKNQNIERRESTEKGREQGEQKRKCCRPTQCYLYEQKIKEYNDRNALPPITENINTA